MCIEYCLFNFFVIMFKYIDVLSIIVIIMCCSYITYVGNIICSASAYCVVVKGRLLYISSL